MFLIVPLILIFTNIIDLYDNILINRYQGLIRCNRLTPSHHPPPLNDSHSITIMLMWSLIDYIRDREHLFWSYPFISRFSSYGEQFQAIRDEAAEKAAVRVNAAVLDDAHPLAADDDSSAAAATLPVAPVAVDERGESLMMMAPKWSLSTRGSRKVGLTRRRHLGQPSL